MIHPDEHGLDPKDFGKEVLSILKHLSEQGCAAYIVGGGIRDLLANKHPKDFDIVTDARPEEIKKMFKNSLLIGRRFKLVHVRFGRYRYIEVTTFRGKATKRHHRQRAFSLSQGGQITRDNVYGDILSDFSRRDLSINALYYNYQTNCIEDYVGGYIDMQQGIVRILGEPKERFLEDPVRILRAARMQVKLGFSMEESTQAALMAHVGLLAKVSPDRLYLETVKLFHGGYAKTMWQTLKALKILPVLFPLLVPYLKNTEVEAHILHALENTDTRVRSGNNTNPAFLWSIFL